MEDVKIFTNFRGDGDINWIPYLTYYEPPKEKKWLKAIPFIGDYLNPLLHAIIMYRKRNKYDLALLASSRSGNIFSIIQAILPGKKTPIFFFSNLWEVNDNRLLYWLKWVQIYLMNKNSIGFALNSSVDAIPYSKYYPIPYDKFICLPYFTTLWKYNYEIKDNCFIFSGGNGQRDYNQLIEAARSLPYKFIIASNDKGLFEGISIPSNVTVEGVSHNRFRELMATATIHIVAMAGGFLRSGGHQTYLNGMAMGKPVIVTDKKGTLDYIEDGVDGFLLEPGDIEGLSKVITRLMENPELRKIIGENAKEKADKFNGSEYLKNLRELAVSRLSDRHK